MFQGENVRRVEELLSKQRGEEIKDSFGEISISSPKVDRFMAIIRDTGGAVVMAAKKTANQGMGESALRNPLDGIRRTPA